MNEKDDIWFPAKRYGWGWGPPNTWQGWAVVAVYALCMAVNAVHFLGRGDITSFTIATAILTAFLVLICWAKGEKPEWRWGGK